MNLIPYDDGPNDTENRSPLRRQLKALAPGGWHIVARFHGIRTAASVQRSALNFAKLDGYRITTRRQKGKVFIKKETSHAS